MKSKMPWLLFVLLLVLSSHTACFSIAADTLSPGHSLSLSKGETFELGFFKPATSIKIYLGIWYKRFDGKDSVWVANRENPLSDLFSPTLKPLRRWQSTPVSRFLQHPILVDKFDISQVKYD
jgi:hypothetical protein